MDGRIREVFFTDEKLGWQKVRDQWRELSKNTTLESFSFQEGGDKPPENLVALADKVFDLYALFLISRNAREDGIWADLHELGATTQEKFSPSPGTPLLAVGLLVAVSMLIGVVIVGFGASFDYLTRLIWPEFFIWPESLGQNSRDGFEPDALIARNFMLWGGYSIVAYLVPVAILMAYRYLSFVVGGRGAEYSLMLGLTSALLGYVSSTVCLIGLAHAFEFGWHGDGPMRNLFENSMLWGIGPALACWLITRTLLRTPRISQAYRLNPANISFREPVLRVQAAYRARLADLAMLEDPDANARTGVARPLGSLLKTIGFSSLQGVAVAMALAIATYVAASELRRDVLFIGSGFSLERTIMKYAAYEGGDLELLNTAAQIPGRKVFGDPTERLLTGFIVRGGERVSVFTKTFIDDLARIVDSLEGVQAQALRDLTPDLRREVHEGPLRMALGLSRAEHTTARACVSFLTGRSAGISFVGELKSGEISLSEALGMCNQYFDGRRRIVLVQAIVGAALLGFLLMVVCGAFNMGLMPETIQARKEARNRETSLLEIYERNRRSDREVRAPVRREERNSYVFMEGEPATEAYFVRSGAVQILHDPKPPNGPPMEVLATIGPGEISGEYALTLRNDGGQAPRRTANAWVSEDCELEVITEHEFSHLLGSFGPFSRKWIDILIDRGLVATRSATTEVSKPRNADTSID